MRTEFWRKAAVAGFLFLFIFLHLFLLYSTFNIDQLGNIHTSYSGFGDIPFHMTQIAKFAFGSFNLSNPVYLGAPLHYPFAINLFSGLLLWLTGSWTFSVLAPIFLLAIANILLVYYIYRKVLNNRFLAIAGILLFFIGFNVGAFQSIHRAIVGHATFSDLVTSQIKGNETALKFDAKYPDQNIVFGSPLSMAFLHQRTFLLGFFAFLILTCLLLKVSEHKKRRIIEDYIGTAEGLNIDKVKDEKKSKKANDTKLLIYEVVAGIVYGLTPILHMHSFIAASILLFVVAMAGLLKKDKRYLIIIVIGILVALPQILLLVDLGNVGKSGSGFIHPRIGWMTENAPGSVNFSADESNLSGIRKVLTSAYFKFTAINFGPIVLLFVLATIVAYKKRRELSEQKWVHFSIISAVVILIVVECLKLQPWDFDDNKLLVYFQFLAAPVVLWCAGYCYEKRRLPTVIVFVALIMLVAVSGFFDLAPRMSLQGIKSPVIFSADAIRFSDYVKDNVPVDSVILTGQSSSNPISSLAGRDILSGYGGWLWSMGIDASQREKETKDFYKQPTLKNDFLKKYSIRYVMLDDDVRGYYMASSTQFDSIFTKAFVAGQYALYKI